MSEHRPPDEDHVDPGLLERVQADFDNEEQPREQVLDTMREHCANEPGYHEAVRLTLANLPPEAEQDDVDKLRSILDPPAPLPATVKDFPPEPETPETEPDAELRKLLENIEDATLRKLQYSTAKWRTMAGTFALQLRKAIEEDPRRANAISAWRNNLRARSQQASSDHLDMQREVYSQNPHARDAAAGVPQGKRPYVGRVSKPRMDVGPLSRATKPTRWLGPTTKDLLDIDDYMRGQEAREWHKRGIFHPSDATSAEDVEALQQLETEAQRLRMKTSGVGSILKAFDAEDSTDESAYKASEGVPELAYWEKDLAAEYTAENGDWQATYTEAWETLSEHLYEPAEADKNVYGSLHKLRANVQRLQDLLKSTPPYHHSYAELHSMHSQSLSAYVMLRSTKDAMSILYSPRGEDGMPDFGNRSRPSFTKGRGIQTGDGSRTVLYQDGTMRSPDAIGGKGVRVYADGTAWQPDRRAISELDVPTDVSIDELRDRYQAISGAWFWDQGNLQAARDTQRISNELAKRLYAEAARTRDPETMLEANVTAYWSEFASTPLGMERPSPNREIHPEGSISTRGRRHGIDGWWMAAPDGSLDLYRPDPADPSRVVLGGRYDRYGRRHS